ncbi:unnamed protein product, partial [Mesorhabditis spiculigera]
MHVNEDAEILARLGILHSTEESPKREQKPANAKFVEVDIHGVEHEEDSDMEIFDRNTLLSHPAGRERISTHQRRYADTPVCRFLLLVSSFFAAGLALHSTPNIFQLSMSNAGHALPIIQMFGLVVGALLARTYVPRFNSMWLLFVCISVLAALSIILLSPQDATSLRVIVLVQGICVATIKYAGLSTWFMWWRASHRKFFWILFAFCLGAAIPSLLRSPMIQDMSDSATTDSQAIVSAHQMHRRELLGFDKGKLPDFATPAPGPPVASNMTDGTPKPGRPDGATGAEHVDTKAAENEKKREEVQVKQTPNTTTSSTTVTTTTTTASTTTARATVRSDGQTSTAPSSIKKASQMVNQEINEIGSKIGRIDDAIGNKLGDMKSAMYRVADLSVEWAVVTVLMMVVVLFILSFFACCLSWSPIADSRVAKLSDHTSPGLSAGCRLRITISHALVSLISFALMEAAMAEGESYNILVSIMMALIMLLASVIGGACCTSSAAWLFVLSTLIGSTILSLANSSYLGFLLATTSAPMISCSLVMRIEKEVGARPSQNIDMYLLCNFGTRMVFTAACYLFGRFSTGSLLGFTFLASLALVPMVYLSGTSLKRAARLKEIYEFTNEYGGEPHDVTRVGNYTMLEVPSSDTDEDEL